MPKFKPGISGNPNGRPPNPRALSKLLESFGGIELRDGETHQQRLAHNLWQLLTHGTLIFEDGRELHFNSAEDWLKAASFLIQHVDGPATMPTFDGKLEICVSREDRVSLPAGSDHEG